MNSINSPTIIMSKKGWLTSVLALLVLSTPMLNKPANADITLPATMCQPANLQQALNLGLGWSQFGVTNNAAINDSGFFIVCPIVLVDGMDTYDSHDLEVQYLDPAAEDITCTVAIVEVQGAAGVIDGGVLNVGTNPGTNNGVFSNTDTSGISYSHGAHSGNIICALFPQTRISHSHVNGS